MAECHIDGCVGRAKSFGLCGTHYYRVRRHGHPQADTPIRKQDGTGSIVVRPDGYRVHQYKKGGKTYHIYEHRTIMEEKLGRPLAPDETVHHINGDRGDNRPENLELWVSSHPPGQRPGDLVAWAWEILERYS